MNSQFRNKFLLILGGNIILILLIAAGVQDIPAPLAILRLILGLIYVLFIPGYTLQLLLFPRNDELDQTERIALSLALSGAIIPPIALLLDKLPWGISLWSMVIGLSIFSLVCLIGATIWRIILTAGGKIEPASKLSLRQWWVEQERANRIVYIILAGILVTASLTSISILVTPKQAENFSEFYILGKEGLAEDYPREITAGEMVKITTGITNREGTDSTYNIQVKLDDQVIGEAGPIDLENGATWEQAVEFSVPAVGEDQQIQFFLDREGQPSPYRLLKLWLNVTTVDVP